MWGWLIVKVEDGGMRVWIEVRARDMDVGLVGSEGWRCPTRWLSST